MRAVIQRVEEASVRVGDRVVGEIGPGLLVLLSVERGDGMEDATYVSRKILGLRVFEDRQGKMNLSVQETKGELLIVSQFTLHGDCRRGNRPSFSQAESPLEASSLFDRALVLLRASELKVATGVFAAKMRVSSLNAGPVTILLDSRRRF